MASNLESLRKLAANYWQPALGILSLVPSLLQFLGEFQKGEGLSHAKPWIYLAGGIACILIIRYPKIAIRITGWLMPPEPVEKETAIFRGLQSYSEDDRPLFFGRTEDVERCWLRVRDRSFFTLDGESGSGKSSFLNAGLIPRAKEKLLTVSCRVGKDPFGQVLYALTGERKENVEKADLIQKVEQLGQKDPAKPILLCIDQFDEFFVTVPDAARRAFLETLQELIRAQRLRVLICVRSDFTDLLLAACRSLDPHQAELRLEDFYTLNPFSDTQATSVLMKMFAPIYKDDPVRTQEISDFASALVQDLLRPPRDKRLAADTSLSVLPVELQMVGMTAEALGPKTFSAKAYSDLGRKLGLYRRYIESTKDYVLRKTGVTGDVTLLILRELASPADTKTRRMPAEIAKNLKTSAETVRKVLDALCDRYLVTKYPPTHGTDETSAEYEFLHEHLVQLLREAPEPYLQKLRDAEERLGFWRGRTGFSEPTTDKSDQNIKAGFLGALKDSLAQPIPLIEAIRLYTFARNDADRSMLKLSIFGFLKRLSIAFGVLLATAAVILIWTRTDSYQVDVIVDKAPVSELITLGESDAIGNWVSALGYLGRVDDADRAAAVLDPSSRSRALARAAQSMVLAGDSKRAQEVLLSSLSVVGLEWTDDHAVSTTSVASDRALNNSDETFVNALNTIPQGPVAAEAMMYAARGFAQSGHVRQAKDLFTRSSSMLNGIADKETQCDLRLILSETEHQSGLQADAVQASDGALLCIRKEVSNGDQKGWLFSKWAASRATLCSADDAQRALVEASAIKRTSWGGEEYQWFEDVAAALGRNGKAADAVSIAQAYESGASGADYKVAIAEGLVDSGSRNEALKVINSIKSWGDRVEPSIRVLEHDLKIGVDPSADEDLVKPAQGESQRGLGFRFPFVPDQHGINVIVGLVKLGHLGTASTIANFRSLSAMDFPSSDKSAGARAVTTLIAAGDLNGAIALSDKLPPADICVAKAEIDAALAKQSSPPEFDSVRNCIKESRIKEMPYLAWTPIVQSLALNGKFEAAYAIVDQAGTDGLKDSLLREIAIQTATAGTMEQALVSAGKIRDATNRSSAISEVAIQALKKTSPTLVAFAMPAVDSESERSSIYRAVAEWQVRSGRFRLARKAADQCSSPKDRMAAYTLIILQFARTTNSRLRNLDPEKELIRGGEKTPVSRPPTTLESRVHVP